MIVELLFCSRLLNSANKIQEASRYNNDYNDIDDGKKKKKKNALMILIMLKKKKLYFDGAVLWSRRGQD